MASYYPIPFAIPAGDRIVAVMLQKLDCGNNCTRHYDSEDACICSYFGRSEEDTCSYCRGDHYVYNEIIITTSSDKFDKRPDYTCWIIKNGTTSIISPKNNEVFTIPNCYKRDYVHSFTIVMESFNFAISSDDSDIDVFEPHIDLLVNITGCYIEIQRANLRAKSEAFVGAGGAGAGTPSADSVRATLDAQMTIEQMIMERMMKTMRFDKSDKSVYKVIHPIARTFANAIVRARIRSRLTLRIAKGECPHIGKAGKVGRKVRK